MIAINQILKNYSGSNHKDIKTVLPTEIKTGFFNCGFQNPFQYLCCLLHPRIMQELFVHMKYKTLIIKHQTG